MKKTKPTAPVKAGLSALTLAGLVAAGCTLSTGAAVADAPAPNSSVTLHSGDASDQVIAAARAAMAKASEHLAKSSTGRALAGGVQATDGSTEPSATATPTPTPSPTTSPAKPAALSWWRLSGADRYATAVAVAKSVYPKSASTVFVATGTNFPDALSAGPVAVAKDGPLLLTQRDSIPSSTLAEIKALRPSTVVVIGGTSAVSANVATQLGKLSSVKHVTRVGGADRYATSRLLANYAFGTMGAEIAFIATGANYPDALSVSSPAGTTGSPILLVNGKAGSLDSATFAELKKLGVAYTAIAGGPAAVSRGIEYSTPTLTARFAGADRYATNSVVATAFYSNDDDLGADANPGGDAQGDDADDFVVDSFFVATGENFPDALVGSVPAAWNYAPMLLAKKTSWPKATLSFVKSNGFEDGYLLGGTDVLSDSLAKLNTSF